MKSLLISSIYFPPQIGGISHFMQSIGSALGPDRVCCLTGVPASDCRTRNAFHPRVYRRPRAFAKSPYIQAVSWGLTISQIMLRERPQVVQLATAYDGYLGLWLRRWLRLPFVIYAHGNEILVAMQSDWRKPRLALQQANRILANSRFTAKLVEQAGVAPDRIEIVHPGCDIHRFRPLEPKMDLRQRLLGHRHRDRVILTVGGLVERKGHDMVIRALPRLRKSLPQVSYLIVGDGPCRGELEALACKMEVRDHVVFAGLVPATELPDVYALSDVFIMPSREQLEAFAVEGFGMVFHEASACAKPVVGGLSGGISEAIVEGVTGLLVNPHDPEEIASVLKRILTSKELAARLGEGGRARVVKEFNWARVGARVQGILDSVLRKKGQNSFPPRDRTTPQLPGNN